MIFDVFLLIINIMAWGEAEDNRVPPRILRTSLFQRSLLANHHPFSMALLFVVGLVMRLVVVLVVVLVVFLVVFLVV
jgi:hypothetical protein